VHRSSWRQAPLAQLTPAQQRGTSGDAEDSSAKVAPVRSHEEVRGALARPLTKLVHTDFCSRRCDTAGGRRSATTACAGGGAWGLARQSRPAGPGVRTGSQLHCHASLTCRHQHRVPVPRPSHRRGQVGRGAQQRDGWPEPRLHLRRAHVLLHLPGHGRDQQRDSRGLRQGTCNNAAAAAMLCTTGRSDHPRPARGRMPSCL